MEKYQLIVVLDSRTSKIYLNINKKIFNVRDAFWDKEYATVASLLSYGTCGYISVSKDTIKDDYDMIEDPLDEDMPNKRVYDKLKSSGNSYEGL